MIKVIVGLGNLGPQYEKTRHNVGWWLLDAWASLDRLSFRRVPQFKADIAEWRPTVLKGETVYVVKPQTYMNVSGEAVAPIMRFYQAPAESLLVVHDDIDLSPGIGRLKKGGGHAGHNGLKSLEQHLGTRDFWRLRIGVGRPTDPRFEVADFVLGKPTKGEEAQIIQTLDDIIEVTDKLLTGQMEQVKNGLHANSH